MDTERTASNLAFLEDDVEVLGEAEALALAATVTIGRVVYSRFALPAVQVVNFALDGRDVVIPTREGAKIGAALADCVVTFEVDRIDEATDSGWTVTLTGLSRLVTDPAECQRLAASAIDPWGAGDRGHFIRIGTQVVAGWRIGPQDLGTLTGGT